MKHSVTKTCFKALFCAYGIGILMTIGLIIANWGGDLHNARVLLAVLGIIGEVVVIGFEIRLFKYVDSFRKFTMFCDCCGLVAFIQYLHYDYTQLWVLFAAGFVVLVSYGDLYVLNRLIERNPNGQINF